MKKNSKAKTFSIPTDQLVRLAEVTAKAQGLLNESEVVSLALRKALGEIERVTIPAMLRELSVEDFDNEPTRAF